MARATASAPTADCAEPARLVQLGTAKEELRFNGQELRGEQWAFDPETLTPRALASVAPLPPRVVPAPYAEITGGRGLVWHEGENTALVKDIATGTKLFRSPDCEAGGLWSYWLSTTGRFLICDSNRSGLSLWDLQSKPAGRQVVLDQASGGEGVALAPNDRYAVIVPVMTWGGDVPSRSDAVHLDLDSGKRRPLSKAPDPDRRGGNPYGVAFCGQGALVAVAGAKELTVYRGLDGVRLAAAAAMKGGVVSFSASGRYMTQTRGHATTIFRLEP